MKRDCFHEKSIDYRKVMADLREVFSSEAAARLLFMDEEVSVAKENWICIDVRFAQQTDCPKRVGMIYDSSQLIEHRRKHGAKVYINIFTLEVVCFACNVEILDEAFTGLSPARLKSFKAEVRSLVSKLAAKVSSKCC